MRKSPWYGICAVFVVLPVGCHVGGGGLASGGGRSGGGVGGAGGGGDWLLMLLLVFLGCVWLCVLSCIVTLVA